MTNAIFRGRPAWVLAALLWALAAAPAWACTLWGAAGPAADGGTLVAKNRDWKPDHRQELRRLRPSGGFHAIALTAVGGEEPGVKAGVNTEGLVIVSATAGQAPAAARRKPGAVKGLTAHLLARCATVAEVLGAIERFGRPVFYLIGDRREIAVIEVAPDGRRSVTRTSEGTLSHTNHYLAAGLPAPAVPPGASSFLRQARIESLLGAGGRPFTFEDFIRLSADRDAGPDNSIWRTGSRPGRTRTLATWIVSVPASGSPQLFVKMVDPGAPERLCRLSVAEALAAAPGEDGVVVELQGALCRPPPR